MLGALAVAIAGQLGGRTAGLVAATAMAGTTASAMAWSGVASSHIARDNLTYWGMCLLLGGGIGHLAEINRRLLAAHAEIQRLRGFLPICAECKKVRNDDGLWQRVEDYLYTRSELRFSHCLCPTCSEAAWRDLASSERAAMCPGGAAASPARDRASPDS